MNRIKEYLKYLMPAYILSFLLSFMFFIYEPILTYSANIEDFWFDFKLMFPNIMIYFIFFLLSLMTLSTIVFIINRFFSKKVLCYKIILITGFILTIFLYIQGNYLLGNLPALDGTTIDWNNYKTDNLISGIILLLIIVTEVILLTKLKYKKTIIVNSFLIITIFAMIFASFISRLLLSNVFMNKTVPIVTIANINKASNNKNFYIFLADAVDSTEFNNVLKESEEYNNTFENFTYFPDTVSGYLYTRDSIPFIFSGEWNENKVDFIEYSTEAYNNSRIFASLKEKEYEMNFYENELQWNSNKANSFSNIKLNETNIKKILFLKQLIKYDLFKYLPYCLKSFSKIETVNFNFCKNEKETVLFNWENDEAYNNIINNQIEKIDNNYFQFIHIEGAHVPFNYDEELNRIDETKGTYKQKVKATLKVINAFINRLKENNVYDNSVIVVMADHGYWATTDRQNPILYIKGFEEHHELKESQIAVSHEDLVDTFIELLNGTKSSELFSNINPDRVRRFILNAYQGENEMIEYEQRGKAWDSSAIFETGRKFII